MADVPVEDADPVQVKNFKRKMTERTAAKTCLMQNIDRGKPCLKCGDACEGFDYHVWRKCCRNCGCGRMEHDVDWLPGMNRPVAKVIKGDEPEPEVVEAPKKKKKKKRSASQRRRLEHQDPLHDHDADACTSLGDDEHQVKSFQLLNDKRNEMYGVGKEKECADDAGDDEDLFAYAGHCCQKCTVPFVKGDSVIEATLTTGPIMRHTPCFCCHNCDAQLEEHKFYEYEGEIYCGRCHAEMFMPRCAGCDELIFDPTYTVAEGKKWHLVHFCCWVCDTDLCEKQYAKDPDENPVCLPCYNDKYAVTCATCNEPITAGEKAMRAGDQSYHHTEACFRCKVCTCPLENKKCVQYQDDIYCTDCYQNVHSPPCGRCNERINGEYVEVRGKRYMKSCFSCFECNVPFTREEKKGAYPIGDRLLCYDHAKAEKKKELVAKRAAKEEEERKKKDEEAETARQAFLPKAAQSSFIRKGTRQVTRIKKAPKGSVRPNAAEKAAMLAAVKKAEEDSAAQTMEDTIEDDEDDEEEGGSADQTAAAGEGTDAGGDAEAGAGADGDGDGAEAADAPVQMRPKKDKKAAAAKDLGAELLAPDTQPPPAALTPSGSQSSKKEDDPFAALWAGFSIPMKFAKFSLDLPGREVLDIGAFMLITKKKTVKAYLVLCTDVAFIAQMVDDDCYEMMYMPVERTKVKAKLAKMKGVIAMKVKVGKMVTLKVADEVERSQWIGKLNAPIGFVPTKALG